MGRQIGFYMTSADEKSFIEALQADADVVVVLNHFPTKEPQILEALPSTGSNYGTYTNLSIYNRDIQPKLIVYEIVARNEFSLNLDRSEVIQFIRSFVWPDGKMQPGRLWYEPKYGRPKRKPFLTWAERVYRLLRKNFSRVGDNPQFFGPDARIQYENKQLVPAY